MRIIAEIGSNWDKSNDRVENLVNAYTQIQEAKLAGATDVKFQFYSHHDLYGQKGEIKSALPKEWLPKLYEHCELFKINFLCSAFSKEGYDTVNPYVDMHKVASCESADLDLIDHVVKFGKPIMISTGGLDQDEIEHIMLRYPPHVEIIIADCVIDYPAHPDQYDLCVVGSFSDLYTTALSDHTLGYVTALAAQGLGITIFEKHVDFISDERATADSCVSVNAEQFTKYCKVLRGEELPKQISHSEAQNVKMYQRRKTNNGFYRPMPRYQDEAPISQEKQTT